MSLDKFTISDLSNNDILVNNTDYDIGSNREAMISSTPPKSSIPNEYIGIWELQSESTVYTLIIDNTTFVEKELLQIKLRKK